MSDRYQEGHDAGYWRGIFIAMLYLAIFGMIPMISKIWYLQEKIDRLEEKQTQSAKMELIP